MISSACFVQASDPLHRETNAYVRMEFDTPMPFHDVPVLRDSHTPCESYGFVPKTCNHAPLKNLQFQTGECFFPKCTPEQINDHPGMPLSSMIPYVPDTFPLGKVVRKHLSPMLGKVQFFTPEMQLGPTKHKGTLTSLHAVTMPVGSSTDCPKKTNSQTSRDKLLVFFKMSGFANHSLTSRGSSLSKSDTGTNGYTCGDRINIQNLQNDSNRVQPPFARALNPKTPKNECAVTSKHKKTFDLNSEHRAAPAANPNYILHDAILNGPAPRQIKKYFFACKHNDCADMGQIRNLLMIQNLQIRAHAAVMHVANRRKNLICIAAKEKEYP